MKKKLVSLVLAVAMAGTLTACGGSTASESKDTSSDAKEESATEEKAEATGEDVTITIFNSKSEIQDQFEELADEYTDSHPNVTIEVYYSQDTVSAHLATKYASNDPYTLSMVDAKDIYSLAEEHAVDLSDEPWVANTSVAISVNDKVVGFPVCVEARGVMYNADAIAEITGEEFDPSTVKTTEDFKALLEKLVAGGMESPTGVMKEDWSLAAHYLTEVYEEQNDVDGFVDELYAGTADVKGNERYNSLMDTFDLLKEYNYAKSSPISAEREVSEQKLAEGEIAFMFGGNWDWSLIKDFNEDANLGMMPVPQSTKDDYNTKLVGGGSKYFFIDSSDNTSDAQVAAAKEFLNWLVLDEEGNAFLTEKCALVPAYSNIDASSLDPLSKSVKAYADADSLVPNYNYCPDDHYSKLGAAMQKYLANEMDRAGLADAIVSYWSSTTPVEH